MAENETKKEKATINMNLWFVIFLVYLIISLAFCFSLIQENKSLKAEIAAKDTAIADMQYSSQSDLNRLIKTIDNVSNMLAEAKQELLGTSEVTTNPVEVSTGIYSGSSDTLSMTLTLSENNVATLSVVNESGDSTYNGTYSVAEGLVAFTSEDGLSTYSFTAFEDGTLRTVYNNVELALSK